MFALAVLLTLVAASGLPVIPLPSKTNIQPAQDFDRFDREMAAWIAHDGWRYTTMSWFYIAVAVGCLSAALTWGVRGQYYYERRTLTVGGPAVLVLALGPFLQKLSGIPWSNYLVGPDPVPDPPWILPVTLFALYLFILGFVSVYYAIVRFFHRRRSKHEAQPE